MIVDGLSSSGMLKDTILSLFQDQSYLTIKKNHEGKKIEKQFLGIKNETEFYCCYFIVAVFVVQDTVSSVYVYLLKRSKSGGKDNKNTWVRGGYSQYETVPIEHLKCVYKCKMYMGF